MKRSSWAGLLLGACLSAVVLVGGCGKATQEPDASCSVVVVAPLTGQQAALGREISRSVTLMEELRSRTAGGAEIDFVKVDSTSTPSVARAEVSRVAARSSAPVIIGSILSSETKEFLPEVLSQNRVVIANGSSDPSIRTLPFRRLRDGFFRNWPADDFEGRVMAEYLYNSGRAERVAVLHAEDPYAASLSAAFAERFRELGGEITQENVYPLDLTSFATPVAKLPKDVDGYYIVGFPPDLAGIYDTIRRNDEREGIPIFSAVGINTGEFVELVSEPLENLFFTSPAVDEASGPYFDFRRQYNERFEGQDPDIVAAVTFDALALAGEAVDKEGCQADAIKNFLYDMEPFDGASGLTGFDELGDVITKEVSINFYEDGRKLLADTRMAAK